MGSRPGPPGRDPILQNKLIWPRALGAIQKPPLCAQPLPPGWNKHPPLPPRHISQVHTVVIGGMPGSQIALIAAGAALLAAIAAVLVYRHGPPAATRSPQPLELCAPREWCRQASNPRPRAAAPAGLTATASRERHPARPDCCRGHGQRACAAPCGRSLPGRPRAVRLAVGGRDSLASALTTNVRRVGGALWALL
jgi:hypothetical protein